jgi:electron transfer flavoprotein alpha subunit
MANGILVFCETEGGAVKKTAFELLGKAAQLGGPVSAVVIGDGDPSVLGAYGAGTVYTVSAGAYDSASWAGALAGVIEQSDAAVVLGAASAIGKDLFPRVGARLSAGVVSEVTELSNEGGSVVARRPVFAGKALVTARVKSARALYTVRPNSFGGAGAADGGSANVVDAGAVDASASLTTVVETRASSSSVADLTEAERIVAGGRSLKSKEQFDAIIRPLAASIGATPGASRAAVDAGYASHSEQVGQTGKVVNPQLYIAAGISGAIQHLAGMRTSKVIVAINKDPEAPIFQHSSYGIVADLFEVCPMLEKGFNDLG